jgi:hypothetical protein
MNKDKHVMPDDRDTFADRVRREAQNQYNQEGTKIIYGPDNETLSKIDIKK